MTAPLTDERDAVPYRLDLAAQRVLLLRLSAEDRRRAAFLDARGIPPQPQGGWLSLDAFLAYRQPPGEMPIDWIFHIGHCGSTLLSRLIDSEAACSLLREPLPLRDVAAMAETVADLASTDADRLLSALCAWWARPPEGARRVAIKATSSCNGLIDRLLLARARDRVVLLDMPLQPWLATVLKSPDSLRDVAAAAASRRMDLASRLGVPIAGDGIDDASLCALGWIAEQQRFTALQARHPSRVLRVDFERLLANRAGVIGTIVAHFDLPANVTDDAVTSPWWLRYAKEAAHAYDDEDRRHDLALSERRFGVAIAQGMRWAHEFFEAHPAAAGRDRT